MNLKIVLSALGQPGDMDARTIKIFPKWETLGGIPNSGDNFVLRFRLEYSVLMRLMILSAWSNDEADMEFRFSGVSAGIKAEIGPPESFFGKTGLEWSCHQVPNGTKPRSYSNAWELVLPNKLVRGCTLLFPLFRNRKCRIAVKPASRPC